MNMNAIVYDAEDAARVAELCLAAGCPERIPRYLRQGALPEMIERELTPSPGPRRATAAPVRHDDAALEDAAAARFRAQASRH